MSAKLGRKRQKNELLGPPFKQFENTFIDSISIKYSSQEPNVLVSERNKENNRLWKAHSFIDNVKKLSI